MYTVAVPHSSPPQDIIREAILKRIRNSERTRSHEERLRIVEEHQSAYILKMAGRDMYFLKSCPISQYKYIRACIAKKEIPQLMLMSKKGIFDNLSESEFVVPSYMRKPVPPLTKQTTSLWRLDRPFR